MEHAERAVTLGAPFADADGKSSRVEQIENLFGDNHVRVVAKLESAGPLLELTTIANVGNTHADLDHILSRIRLAVDLDQLAVDMEAAAGFYFRDVRHMRASVYGGGFERHGWEAIPTFWMLVERFLVILLRVFGGLLLLRLLHLLIQHLLLGLL